jgi:hypothetical protein
MKHVVSSNSPVREMEWFASLPLLILTLLFAHTHGFVYSQRARAVEFGLIRSEWYNVPDDSSKKVAESLLNDALRLREEVQNIESAIAERRAPVTPIYLKPYYSQLSGSYWDLSYRFSPEPIQDQDENVRFFSGKVRIHLRPDGYTDFLDHGEGDVQIKKFWGWDEEVSEEDKKTYLMFASDVRLPSISSDSEYSIASKFYFNALVQKDSKSGVIQLSDGIITVKRDILSNPPRILGMLKAASILAEFRQCGTFICKPSPPFDITT